jgi:hypothetical protein
MAVRERIAETAAALSEKKSIRPPRPAPVMPDLAAVNSFGGGGNPNYHITKIKLVVAPIPEGARLSSRSGDFFAPPGKGPVFSPDFRHHSMAF